IEFSTLLSPHVPNAGAAALVVNGIAVCMVCGRAGPFIDPPRRGGSDRSRDRGPDSPALLRRTLERGHDRGGARAAPRRGGASTAGRAQGQAGSAVEPIRRLRGLRPRDAEAASAAARDTAVADAALSGLHALGAPGPRESPGPAPDPARGLPGPPHLSGGRRS